MTQSTTRRAIPVALALLVLVVGVPLAWMGATPVTSACEDAVPADERGQIESRQSLWPPGVHCVSRWSDGRTFEATYVVWYDLTMVAVFAAGVWLLAAALSRALALRPFLLGVLMAAAVFLAANAVFFF